ncbi:hypothetical protein Tco_1126801 [Tanacetum coccineum]
MTFYNSLPRKEYERVFMCKTAKEVWHTVIITHQVNLRVKDFKIDLLTQQYEKSSISNEEAVSHDSMLFLLKNLENDGVVSKTTKEKVKSLAFKAKVTGEQSSDDSDSQRGSDEYIDEEEAEAFNY